MREVILISLDFLETRKRRVSSSQKGQTPSTQKLK